MSGLLVVLAACSPLPSPSGIAASPSVEATLAPVMSADDLAKSIISEEELAEAVALRSQFGLRDDDAWIRKVAVDPAAQVGMEEFGIPLMPAEFADLMSRRWDEDLFRRVRAYGLSFPDDFAGAYINLKGSGVIIEFKDEVDRHRKALANLVADPRSVDVREVEWSLKDLERFREEVNAERAWFDTIGVDLLQVDHRVNENFIHVDFIGPTKNAATAIEAHFGNPTWLSAEWQGRGPWTGPRADLVIKVTDIRGRPVANVRCDVHPEDSWADEEFSGDLLFGTGPTGTCQFSSVPAVAYRIRLHRLIGNDYDPDPVKEVRVLLTPAGKVVPVVIPAT